MRMHQIVIFDQHANNKSTPNRDVISFSLLQKQFGLAPRPSPSPVSSSLYMMQQCKCTDVNAIATACSRRMQNESRDLIGTI
jgi:hypothetical protein